MVTAMETAALVDLQDARYPVIPQLRAGLAFPELTLPDCEDGRPTSLADFRGKRVLLHLFASW